LNEPLTSGRRYVDLARLLDSEPLQPAPENSVIPPKPQPSNVLGVSPFLHFLVEKAVLAPSGGNCQPWRFYAEGEDRLHVVHHAERSRNLLDATRLASCIALGAAIENVIVAAAHCEFEASVESFPIPGNPAWMATVHLAPARALTNPTDDSLFEALARRVTNRRNADPTPLDELRAQELVAAAQDRGGHLELQVGRAALDEMGQILGEADRVRFLCAELHREVMSELRWNPQETETTRDGIDLATLELTQSEAAVMQVLARPDIAAFLRELDGGVALTEGACKSIQGSCAVGLIRVRGEDPASFLEAGRAIQRTWLMATKLGLGFQPMTALLFLFRMLARPEADIFLERERRVLRDLKVRLDRVFSVRTDLSCAMLFRLTHATEVTARALRRPVSEVLHSGRPE
jgi:nitroreductase